ncbi:MAG: hypothetical protein V5786_12185 [Psychromonas sp.]
MKKLNLLLISIVFSNFLLGCGMKGPLYIEEKTLATPEIKPTEQNKATIDDN